MVRVTGEVVDKYHKDTYTDNDNDFSELILVCVVKSLLALLVQQGQKDQSCTGLSSVGYLAYLMYSCFEKGCREKCTRQS